MYMYIHVYILCSFVITMSVKNCKHFYSGCERKPDCISGRGGKVGKWYIFPIFVYIHVVTKNVYVYSTTGVRTIYVSGRFLVGSGVGFSYYM